MLSFINFKGGTQGQESPKPSPIKSPATLSICKSFQRETFKEKYSKATEWPLLLHKKDIPRGPRYEHTRTDHQHSTQHHNYGGLPRDMVSPISVWWMADCFQSKCAARSASCSQSLEPRKKINPGLTVHLLLSSDRYSYQVFSTHKSGRITNKCREGQNQQDRWRGWWGRCRWLTSSLQTILRWSCTNNHSGSIW